MFRYVVVGADESREGEDAVALGAAVATATGSALTLMCSVGTSPASRRTPGHEHARRLRTTRQLRAYRDRWAPQAQIELTYSAGIAQALRAHAERHTLDLVVIGSSRRAPLGRCAIGRTGRELLSRAPAATLAIAGRGLSNGHVRLETIAVGYDGGPESESARQLGEELASAAGADLLIETIYELPIPTLPLGDPSHAADELRAAERRAALDVARRAVRRTSPRTRMRVCVGEPGCELRKVSAGVDLMVIGSRRRGPSGRTRRWEPCVPTVLGGVGEALVSDCGSSLLLTPRVPGAESALALRCDAAPQMDLIVPRM